MSKLWQEEPYVSRVCDEIYITSFGGDVSFNLVKKRNNEGDELAHVEEIDKLFGNDVMHCLCDEFLHHCHQDKWDGD